MAIRSLNQGTITAQETVIYAVPNNVQTSVTLLTFANNSNSTVILTVYKKVNGQNFAISPVNMTFPAGYYATEDEGITLSNNDSIVATCSSVGAVSFTANGIESAAQ